MIENLHKNIMGTTSFNGRFGKMRKVEEFDVYPIAAENAGKIARIQSDSRSGFVYLETGRVAIFEGRHFVGALKYADQLSAEDLLMFKAAIAGTANAKAGQKENGIVHCDNSGAVNVLMVCGDASHARE